MLQTIEVDIDADGIIHPLQTLPKIAERRALLTLVIPQTVETEPRAKVDWRTFVGILADSPNFNGNPIEIQRKLRDEWN
ncbi:MAG: hypothetical protein WC742_09055 [Gallionellaceae bacterium]|jgi:hypothetical protein